MESVMAIHLKKQWVLKVLREEVEFHQSANPEETMTSEQYRKVFIKGLKQAILLIKEME